MQAIIGMKPYDPNLVKIFKLFKLNKIIEGAININVIY